VEQLDQVDERDLRELALELAARRALASHGVHTRLPREHRDRLRGDLLRRRLAGQRLVEGARRPRGRAAEEQEARLGRARVRAQDLGQAERVDQRQLDRRDHELRDVGERRLERGRPRLDAARLETAGQARLEHARAALAVAVRDEDRASH
jgi:hypothetical protein